MNRRFEKELGGDARLSKMEGGFSPEVQQVLARTRREGGFSPEQYRDIEAAIASSPHLHNYLDAAAKSGNLHTITLAGEVPGMAGFYDERSRSIRLTPKAWGDSREKKDQLDVLTGTLGHEAGHAITRLQRAREWQLASHAVANASRDAQPNHTEIAERYISYMRHDEAIAETFSWNAVNSRVRQEMGERYNQQEFLQRVAATTHCTVGKDAVRPAPGLQLSPEGYLQMEGATQQATIDAVARCHFDRPAAQSRGGVGLGEEFNYRNYYAARVANLVAHHGKVAGASKVFRADMDRLGVDPEQMQRAGFDFGGQGQTLRYENLRGERMVGSGLLHDLGRGRAGPVPDAEVAVVTSRKAPGLDDPSHPQHSLYRKIRQSLPPETSADRLAQIVAHAHAEGMREDKDVRAVTMVGATVHVLSQTLGFRSETDLTLPPPSAEQSRQQVEAQQQQAEQALQQQVQQREQQREQQQQHSRSLH